MTSGSSNTAPGRSDARADLLRDAEDFALGGMLLDTSGETARRVFQILEPNDLGHALRRAVGRAIQHLAERGDPITLPDVWLHVVEAEPGYVNGSSLVTFASWVDDISSAAPAIWAARIVRRLRLENDLSLLHADAADHGEDEDTVLQLKSIRDELDRLDAMRST